MIYYRSSSASSRELSVGATRRLSLAALATYPAGALLLAQTPASLASTIAGYSLILASLASIVPLISSSLQRIVGEQTHILDEYELKLRSEAMNQAYNLFSALVLSAVIYLAVATDFGMWVPRSYDNFSALFWGIFIYATVLPVAILSWLVDDSFGVES